jgi:hypothetical protein
MKSHTVIAHAHSGDLHAVTAELHVLVSQSEDGEGFVAQGLEIDYVATGATEEEARDHFASGFLRTIRAMCKRGRDLGALFTKSKAPPDAWTKYFAASNQHVLRCISVLDLSESLPDFPSNSPLPRTMRFAAVN